MTENNETSESLKIFENFIKDSDDLSKFMISKNWAPEYGLHVISMFLAAHSIINGLKMKHLNNSVEGCIKGLRLLKELNPDRILVKKENSNER